MIVAVTIVGMMQVPTDKIVKMVPMRHAFVSTGGTVSVAVIVTFAVVIRCTSTRIDVAHQDEMFIDMVLMDMMQVPIVQIVGVALVRYSYMSTLGAMCVRVVSMRFAGCFHEN